LNFGMRGLVFRPRQQETAMRDFHHLLAAALVGSALALALPGFADNAPGRLSNDDQEFLRKAAQDGLAEVQLGQLAQHKAMREEVRQFAARMVDDHAKANEKLKSIAAANGVQVPSSLDRKHEKEMNELSQLIGGDFDRAYMSRMLSEHHEDVERFRERAKADPQNDVTRFAAATLPVLESHMAAARATSDIAQDPKRFGDRETGSRKP
jgi:putative membrane protein